MKRIALLLAAFMAISGCSSDGSRIDGFDVTPDLASQLGKEWPLTVEKATILCGESGALILLVHTSSGATGYALNGTAKSAHKWADLNEIWKDNPDVPGLKVNMWLIDYGHDKCGN